MWTFTTALVELAKGSIRDGRMAEVIANMRAGRKWALENAACALVVFGTIAGVLLFDLGSVRAESTTGSAVYTRSALC